MSSIQFQIINQQTFQWSRSSIITTSEITDFHKEIEEGSSLTHFNIIASLASIKRLDHILFCRQEGIFPSRCKSAFSKSCWPVVALTLEHTTVQTVCAFPQTTQPEIYIYFSPFLHPSVKPLARMCGEHPGGLLQTWDMLHFGVFLSTLCPFTIIHSGTYIQLFAFY